MAGNELAPSSWNGPGNQLQGQGNPMSFACTRCARPDDPSKPIAYYDPGFGFFGAQALGRRSSVRLEARPGLRVGFRAAGQPGQAYLPDAHYRPGDRLLMLRVQPGAYCARRWPLLQALGLIARSGEPGPVTRSRLCPQ